MSNSGQLERSQEALRQTEAPAPVREISAESCSRRIVPALQRLRYNVVYYEFDGPHTIPPEVACRAVAWFLGNPRRR